MSGVPSSNSAFARELARRVFDLCLNTFLPASCILCEQPVKHWTSGAICERCESRLATVHGPMCPVCGLSADAIRGLCGECRAGRTGPDFARSALVFDADVRRLVHEFKYNDRISLARPFGRALQRTFLAGGFRAAMAVPVPLHRSRERERGYNQAEVLARTLGMRVDSAVLRRVRPTPSQTGLTRYQRRLNIRGAFACTRPVRGAVLLVDDVRTTGATIHEAARTLRRSGAGRVEALTLARADYRDE